LADLLYFNELAIRERISEKMLLMKMFKFKAVKNDDVFTKAYSRNEIDQLISNLSFFKIIEDSFDYKQAKINESFARDVAV
jgi:cellobiose-specific phosphotransferase system component IIB